MAPASCTGHSACQFGIIFQCEVAAYRLVCAEAALDYWRFAVSRLAPEESEVSRC